MLPADPMFKAAVDQVQVDRKSPLFVAHVCFSTMMQGAQRRPFNIVFQCMMKPEYVDQGSYTMEHEGEGKRRGQALTGCVI